MSGPGWKPGQGLPIDGLYAWIATEPDGGEGIISMIIPGVGLVPLVGADMEHTRSFRPYAEKVRRDTGYPIRFIRLSTRDDLEVLP